MMNVQIDVEDAISRDIDWINDEIAVQLSEPSLKCIDKEFPHHGRQLGSEGSFRSIKEDNPIFFGCYDWHSSVHSHWNLLRQIRLIEDHPLKDEIIERLDEHFKDSKVADEVEFFQNNRTFEKPYGWSWFLRLMSELYLLDDGISNRWERVLTPLEEKILELTRDEFLKQERPLRVGTHGNSAFALANMLDYARIKSDVELESKLVERSKEFFIDDTDAPVEYEPIGWDFLSPTLTEADLMRRVLDENEYVEWLDEFLPYHDKLDYNTFLEPIKVDLDELMKFHLVGLNLSKAWCLKGIASSLPENHRYTDLMLDSSKKHAEEGLKQAFSEDYGGSHWLLSFALYLFTMDEN